MRGFPDKPKIDYVLFHLGMHCTLGEQVTERFLFLKDKTEAGSHRGKVIFILSENPFSENSIRWENGIPLLYADNSEKLPFVIKDGNLIFFDDILKASFYLLSGFQETESTAKDSLGRYDATGSVQVRLGFISKPVVNYYFDIIIRAITSFSIEEGFRFTNRELLTVPLFFLTHDVDRVKYYTFYNLLYNLKMAFSSKVGAKKRMDYLGEAIRIKLNILNPFRNSDPYWNFRELSGIEKQNRQKSTWFFLPKDRLHADSYYKFSDKKIKSLFNFLISEGHEIALHGTVASHKSTAKMREIYNSLQVNAGVTVTGVRQHRLMWDHPQTAMIQEDAGLKYDSTLGLAMQEGFRNSYCHPFRLFDFNNNRMISTWEIPLNVMDSTLFYYRKLDFIQAECVVGDLITEVKKFNGIFTLLWHNSYFSERETPGITQFYYTLLKRISSEIPESVTGKEIIFKIDNLKNDQIGDNNKK